jgi:hypothetical protein
MAIVALRLQMTRRTGGVGVIHQATSIATNAARRAGAASRAVRKRVQWRFAIIALLLLALYRVASVPSGDRRGLPFQLGSRFSTSAKDAPGANEKGAGETWRNPADRSPSSKTVNSALRKKNNRSAVTTADPDAPDAPILIKKRKAADAIVSCPDYSSWYEAAVGNEVPHAAPIALVSSRATSLCFLDPVDLPTMALALSSAPRAATFFLITPRPPGGPLLRMLLQRNKCAGQPLAKHVPDATLVPTLRCDVTFVSDPTRWKESMKATGYGNSTYRYVVFADGHTYDPLRDQQYTDEADHPVEGRGPLSMFGYLRPELESDLGKSKFWRDQRWRLWPKFRRFTTLVVAADTEVISGALAEYKQRKELRRMGIAPRQKRQSDGDDQGGDAYVAEDDSPEALRKPKHTDPPLFNYLEDDVDSQREFVRFAASRYVNFSTMATLVSQFHLDTETGRQMLHHALSAASDDQPRAIAIRELFKQAAEARSAAFRSRLAAIQFRSSGIGERHAAAPDGTKHRVVQEGHVNSVVSGYREVANSAFDQVLMDEGEDPQITGRVNSASAASGALKCSKTALVEDTKCARVVAAAEELLDLKAATIANVKRKLMLRGLAPAEVDCLDLCPPSFFKGEAKSADGLVSNGLLKDRRRGSVLAEMEKALRLSSPALDLALTSFRDLGSVAILHCQATWIVLTAVAKAAIQLQQLTSGGGTFAGWSGPFHQLEDKKHAADVSAGELQVVVVNAEHCALAALEHGFPPLPVPPIVADVPSDVKVLVVEARVAHAYLPPRLPAALQQVWITGPELLKDGALDSLLDSEFECMFADGSIAWWVRSKSPETDAPPGWG